MAGAAGAALGDYREAAQALIGLIFLWALVWLVSMADGWRRGHANARIFLLSFAIYCSCLFLRVAYIQGLLPGLMSHKFDFVATSVGITPERAKRFAFSQPVGVVRSVLMVRADDAAIKQDMDIAGKTIGTQMGSSSQPVQEKTPSLVVCLCPMPSFALQWSRIS